MKNVYQTEYMCFETREWVKCTVVAWDRDKYLTVVGDDHIEKVIRDYMLKNQLTLKRLLKLPDHPSKNINTNKQVENELKNYRVVKRSYNVDIEEDDRITCKSFDDVLKLISTCKNRLTFVSANDKVKRGSMTTPLFQIDDEGEVTLFSNRRKMRRRKKVDGVFDWVYQYDNKFHLSNISSKKLDKLHTVIENNWKI